MLPAEPVRRPQTRHRPEAELRRSCLTSGSQDPNRINEPDRVSSMHLCTARRIGLSTRQKSERLCRRGTTESIRRAERAGGSATQHKREPTQRELHSGRTKPKRPPLGETAHLGSAVVDRTTMAAGWRRHLREPPGERTYLRNHPSSDCDSQNPVDGPGIWSSRTIVSAARVKSDLFFGRSNSNDFKGQT